MAYRLRFVAAMPNRQSVLDMKASSEENNKQVGKEMADCFLLSVRSGKRTTLRESDQT